MVRWNNKKKKSRPISAKLFTKARDNPKPESPFVKERKRFHRMTDNSITSQSLTAKLLKGRMSDSWRLERKNRQSEVRDIYQRSQRQMKLDMKKSEELLERQLELEERKVNLHYGLNRYDSDDPRLARKQELADRKLEQIRRRMTRKHERDWKQRFHQLKFDRDKQIRRITKDMKVENRQARHLPAEGTTLWK